MNEFDLKDLVAKIAQEVMNRIEYETMEDENVEGTVAIFTTFVPSKKACAEALKEHFGVGIDAALLEGTEFDLPGFFPFPVEDEDDQQALMEKLAGTENVVLVTPKLSLLYRLADGDDSGFVEQTVLRPLLWGRNVSILLDFKTPKFKRATFFAKVVDALDVLTNMGVRILSYNPASAQEETELLTLVTETQILDAAKAGATSVLCTRDAIVTPLARDKASELGIAINC